MNNPYEVLGVPQGASEDEIKHAYRELVKKYHPDQYVNNPLKDLAEEKLKEINEAYDYLMKNNNNSNYEYSENSYDSSSYNNEQGYAGGSVDYNSIRMDINSGNFAEAERKLNSIRNHDGEWNYLMGIINMRKGWYDAAYSNINTACSMNPSNMEYREALSKLSSLNNAYRKPYSTRRDSTNLCTVCSTLYCADCCCESMGGDLIPCC